MMIHFIRETLLHHASPREGGSRRAPAPGTFPPWPGAGAGIVPRMSTPDLPRRPLGRTGLDVSILGYGSVPIGRADVAFEDAKALLETLLDAGVNLLDTAAAYEDAEAVIGRAVADRRGEYVLVTKTGADRGYAPAWTKPEIARLVDASLQKLRTDAVDVLLLHTCDLETLKKGEVVEAVQAARDAGKTRFIGYSGDNDALDHALDLGVFDVVETSYSLLDQQNRDRIRRARELGVGVLVKRPIANAVPGRSAPPDSPYAAQYWPRWEALDLASADVGDVPWIEAAARFSAYAEGVSSVLVGSGNVDHVRANIAHVADGPLREDVVRALEARFDAVGAEWPGLT